MDTDEAGGDGETDEQRLQSGKQARFSGAGGIKEKKKKGHGGSESGKASAQDRVLESSRKLVTEMSDLMNKAESMSSLSNFKMTTVDSVMRKYERLAPKLELLTQTEDGMRVISSLDELREKAQVLRDIVAALRSHAGSSLDQAGPTLLKSTSLGIAFPCELFILASKAAAQTAWAAGEWGQVMHLAETAFSDVVGDKLAKDSQLLEKVLRDIIEPGVTSFVMKKDTESIVAFYTALEEKRAAVRSLMVWHAARMVMAETR